MEHALKLIALAAVFATPVAQAVPSAMGCLKVANRDNAMLWENRCGHPILVAYCSPNKEALEGRCGEGVLADNPFYTHQFIIPAGGVSARYHHQIIRYDYAVCPATEGVRVTSDRYGGYLCE